MSDDLKLSPQQAYLCMYDYLEKYFTNAEHYDLGMLLHAMNPHTFGDGTPADTTILDDWYYVLSQHGLTASARLDPDEAYDLMLKFIEQQRIKRSLNTAEIESFLRARPERGFDADALRESWEDSALNAIREADD